GLVSFKVPRDKVRELIQEEFVFFIQTRFKPILCSAYRGTRHAVYCHRLVEIFQSRRSLELLDSLFPVNTGYLLPEHIPVAAISNNQEGKIDVYSRVTEFHSTQFSGQVSQQLFSSFQVGKHPSLHALKDEIAPFDRNFLETSGVEPKIQ